jgi:hypothetical protein
MHPYSGRCPICGQGMAVTRLHCRACDTAIEGNFALSRFASLTPEQASFLETFVRCQGKLSWVGEELALSYPTVRGRLNDLIRALGYEVLDEPPAEVRQRSAQQRQSILDDLAAGKINAEAAVALLQA